MSELNDFIQALNEGTITDFTKYLKKSPVLYRKLMAERGIEVDALVAKGEPTVLEILIQRGHATEYYETWKTHPKDRVRSALAEHEYWPEFFINDKRSKVREAVAKANPDYIPHILNRTESEWYCALQLIKYDPDIKPEIVKIFLETDSPYKKRYPTMIEAIELRYKAQTKTPTLLEATMSPYELFITGNPLWVKDVPIEVADRILGGYYYAKEKKQMDQFKSIFGELCQALTWIECTRILERVGLRRL